MKKCLEYLNNFAFVVLFISFVNLYSRPKEDPSWFRAKSSTYSDLNSIIMFSSNSGIAAGTQIIKYMGNTWTKMTPQPPVEVSLITAKSMESIFISSNNKYQESEMYFWNGKRWRKFYQPLANSINTMQFENEFNGIVAGLGEIAILKNNKWQFLSPPTATQIISIAIQSDSIIWALAYDGVIYKYNNSWTSINTKYFVNKLGLFNDNIYVVSNNFVGIIKSDSIHVITNNQRLADIQSFKVLEDGTIITVGLNGEILKYNNNVWSNLNSNVDEKLNSIVMLSNEDGWCVGVDGILLRYTINKNISAPKNEWMGFEKITLHNTSKIIDDEYGVVAADFNNDKLVDIFTCGLYENNHLYMNTGNISFVDEATERGVSGKLDDKKATKEYKLGACAADFDNDGNIDLYVSSLNGKNKYYKNTGDGFFVDYTFIANVGGEITDRTNSVATADVDNDNDLDIFITNETSTNRLFLNNGAGLFSEITFEAGVTTKYGGTGCSFADIDNDGDLDLYVTNWSTKNKLYKNLLVETLSLNFVDITELANVGGYDYTKSNGVAFADIDNDADLDLFVANRKTSNKIYLNNGKGIFTDNTFELLGTDSSKSYGVIINDFDGDSYKDIYVSNVGENQFFKNINGRKFINFTSKYNTDVKGYSTGSASADFDNDGDIDLYIANYIGESSTILINKKDSKNYVEINIEGLVSNRSGIGTKIYSYEPGYLNDNNHLLYYSEINGGSGYGSMNELRQIISTINYNQIDIKIVFPSSIIQTFTNIDKSSILNISEIIGANRNWILTKNFLYRIFFDWHQLFNLIKWVFVLGLILFSILYGRKKYNWLPKIIIGSSFFIALNYYLLTSVFEFQNFVYSSLLPLVSTVTLITVFHLFYDKIMLREKVEIERRELQEKLSRDLHDDLASTLGSVSIYLELLKHSIKNKSENIWTLFNKANELMNNSKQTITDLIWTIKPAPEPLSNFAARTRENFTDIFRERHIQFLVSEDQSTKKINLIEIEKHNIYLIIKESLNNILKHAKATKVHISISVMRNTVIFRIQDNGIGFIYSQKDKKGNGLTNLVQRGKEIDAKVLISSEPKQGTIIEIKLNK